jgi:hypothetical protein
VELFRDWAAYYGVSLIQAGYGVSTKKATSGLANSTARTILGIYEE